MDEAQWIKRLAWYSLDLQRLINKKKPYQTEGNVHSYINFSINCFFFVLWTVCYTVCPGQIFAINFTNEFVDYKYLEKALWGNKCIFCENNRLYTDYFIFINYLVRYYAKREKILPFMQIIFVLHFLYCILKGINLLFLIKFHEKLHGVLN